MIIKFFDFIVILVILLLTSVIGQLVKIEAVPKNLFELLVTVSGLSIVLGMLCTFLVYKIKQQQKG